MQQKTSSRDLVSYFWTWLKYDALENVIFKKPNQYHQHKLEDYAKENTITFIKISR